jgi:hypothetical protein
MTTLILSRLKRASAVLPLLSSATLNVFAWPAVSLNDAEPTSLNFAFLPVVTFAFSRIVPDAVAPGGARNATSTSLRPALTFGDRLVATAEARATARVA